MYSTSKQKQIYLRIRSSSVSCPVELFRFLRTMSKNTSIPGRENSFNSSILRDDFLTCINSLRLVTDLLHTGFLTPHDTS